MADRYTYLPLVGLFVMAAWGAADLAARWPYRRPALGLAAAAVLLPCTWLTHKQTAYWANSECLFRHALDVTSGNIVMHNDLGNVLTWQGRKPEAVEEYLKGLAIAPGYAETHNNLANTLKDLGRTADALRHYRQAIDSNPDYPDAHNNLANTLAGQGKWDDAAREYREALRLRPDWPAPLNQLARLLMLTPQSDPRNSEEAVQLAERACQQTRRRDPDMLDTLAAAYAAAGRFDDAAATAREALRLATAAGRAKLAAEIQERLRLYEAHRPNPPAGK
jgi:tetratricopeptide (TPR) repeat protein